MALACISNGCPFAGDGTIIPVASTAQPAVSFWTSSVLLGSVFGATTCTGWNDDPSDRCTNEMPAFESRRVRTQPLTVTAASSGASPARIARTLNAVLSIDRALLRQGDLVQRFQRIDEARPSIRTHA